MTNPTVLGFNNANNPQTPVSGANLNALSSGSSVLGSAFSNVQGDSAGLGFTSAIAKLHLDSMAVSSGGTMLVWLLSASDNSVYEQGGTSVTPLRAPDVIFAPVAQTAAVDLELLCAVPLCATIKALVKNSLGAATPSNTNGYLKLYYQTQQLIQL
jgi:hypothetical protein